MAPMIAQRVTSRRSAGRLAAVPRRLRLPRSRRGRIALLAALALAVLGGGGWLWLRDSSLVAVSRVTIVGVDGPDAEQITSALRSAARNMTTLDVRPDQLRTAVSPYPVVKEIHVSTQFPHGMRIRVVEQRPVGAIVVGGRTVAVAGDGTLLHDVSSVASLPQIPVKVPPGGARLTDPDARGAAALLAAAPRALLAHISQVTTVAAHGLVAQLRSGPAIYFGPATELRSKWIAASEVLADPGSANAAYVDVTVPQRPAAGADSASASTASQGTAATQPGG